MISIDVVIDFSGSVTVKTSDHPPLVHLIMAPRMHALTVSEARELALALACAADDCEVMRRAREAKP